MTRFLRGSSKSVKQNSNDSGSGKTFSGSLHISTDRLNKDVFLFERSVRSSPECLHFKSSVLLLSFKLHPLDVKLARVTQLDEHSLYADTGTRAFAEPVNHKGDKFHPSALK